MLLPRVARSIHEAALRHRTGKKEEGAKAINLANQLNGEERERLRQWMEKAMPTQTPPAP